MAVDHRSTSRELAEESVFQNREWDIQGVGRIACLLVVVAGSLGLLGGGGVFSDVRQGSGHVTLNYQRFARHSEPTSLHLTIGPEAVVAGQAQVWLSRAFLDRIELEHIAPEPVETRLGQDRVIYHIALEEPETPVEVTIRYQPTELGWTPLQIGVVGGGDLSDRQLIFP